LGKELEKLNKVLDAVSKFGNGKPKENPPKSGGSK
jgi:hypothetical protein